AFFHLLDHLHRQHRLDSLTLAGGCAMNSVANGKVKRKSPFKRVYIQSAAGDAGGAIGAAIITWHKVKSPQRRSVAQAANALAGAAVVGRPVMDHAYLGPASTEAEIAGLLNLRAADIAAAGCEVVRIALEDELCQRTAAAVAEGLVIGWFQGRMEW